MVRIIFMIFSFACLIVLLCTDLDNMQRWLLTGVIVGAAVANWDRP